MHVLVAHLSYVVFMAFLFFFSFFFFFFCAVIPVLNLKKPLKKPWISKLEQTCRFDHIYWRTYRKIPNKGPPEYRPNQIYAHQKRPFSRYKPWFCIQDFMVLLKNFIFCTVNLTLYYTWLANYIWPWGRFSDMIALWK